ncbi:MAG: ABC transporter permease subunit [Bacteroidales bacterium]|uniref:ABC-type dipeptide/oligopeptide/nickel transport system n=1 Tax=Defluviitoga tunisiensis TaxID=1006576 RepID=A0A0C7NLP2_DEFTU|nr:ABC transporter permease [Defluviitoga tunisiensis]CEP78776.1 ABC-type dipeptide/oligopeptide/nickel transport system [Defluviitoga tunisiensis]
MSEEFKRTIKRFFTNPSAVIGVTILIFFIIIAIFAPLIAPPKVPHNRNLEKAQDLLDNYSEDNKDLIILELKNFWDDTYSFAEDDYIELSALMDMIKSYQKKEVTDEELKAYIKELTDIYILNEQYYNKFDEETNKVIKQLKQEFVKSEKKYKDSINYSNMIKNLEIMDDNDKFIKYANDLVDEFNKYFKKSINFDPFIMPNVTTTRTPIPPSREHPFGIVNQKDIFYGVIWGTRTAFEIGLIVVAISTAIGLFIGSVAAYFGGWLEEVLMRITDIFMSIPFMLAAMVLTTILGLGVKNMMIALIVFGWMVTARLIRGNILQAKNEQYVMAAKALGVSDFFVIVKHILPNTIFPVLINATMRIGSMVITAAALSFLGLGAPQGYADWGSILSYSRDWIIGGTNPTQYWFTILYPGIAMILFVIGWNLLGDALRDIFDPRMRH